MKSRPYVIAVMLFLSSCASKDEGYYVRRGEEVKRQLIVELEGAQTLHDLFTRQESLSLLFDEMARTAIEARLFQMKTKKTWEVSADAFQSSRRLAQELRRLLTIPGARAFLERCQAKGFDRIDAFEKSLERPIVKAPSS